MPLKRVSKFKQEWSLKLKEEYLSWLEPNATLERHAECSICCTDFDIGNIGIGAIESHRKGKRHQERLAHKTNPSVLGFFTPQNPVPPSPECLYLPLFIRPTYRRYDGTITFI